MNIMEFERPQKEPFEDLGLISEVAGRKGEPKTIYQDANLAYWDKEIERLSENMDLEMKRRKESDEYQRRTIKKNFGII